MITDHDYHVPMTEISVFLLSYPYIFMSNFLTKLTSAIGVATLVAVSTSASLVSAASEFLPYAEVLADNGVIGAQSTEAGYRLSNNVTRAELAKVVANLGGIEAMACSGDVYSDVGAGLGDLCGFVEALADAGVVSTASATFRPNANVTRAEMIKMILGTLGETPSDVDAGYMDVDGLGDLRGYINRANEIGCISSGMYFRPNASSTRGEAFKVAVVCSGLDVDSTPVDPVDPTTPPTTPGTGSTVAGAVTVALEGQAMAQYVPYNASSVKVGTVKVSASTAGDATVTSFTVNRSGLGNSVGLTISVGQNGSSISESRSVNTATQDAIVRLNNPVVIPAGTSAMFDVLASFDNSSTQNSQHQFTLKAVGTTASVSGAPVTLGLLNTTSYEVSTVKVVSLDFGGVTSGKNDQSLGNVKLQAGNKDVTMSAFTLSKTSGVDLTRAFANVSVLRNGTKVGTATITSDKIYVTGLNTKVLRNDTVTFEIRADVTYVGDGLAGDDVTVDILETTDVSAVEDLTGYATASNIVVAADTIDLSSLDIVWTKNSTKSVTVAPGTTNVVLFDAKVVSSATFDVTSFTLDGVAGLAGTNNDTAEATEFTSLTLTVNGVDYDLLTTTQNGGVGTYNFAGTSDKFRMDPGTPVNVKLVGNLSNGATVGTYSYNVALNVVKNISTGNTVSLAGKNLTGDNVTVSAPELIVKKATVSAPTTTKIYSNATNSEIGRFALEAKAEEVSVREITLMNNTGAGFIPNLQTLVSGTNVKLVNVSDNSQVSASVTVNMGNILLTGMNIKVPKDTTANYKLVVDTQGDLATSLSGAPNFNLNVDIVSVSVSSSAPVTIIGDNSFPDAAKVYTAGVVPPTVTLVKTAANVFKVTVSNTDQDTAITLASITAQVRAVADNNSSYAAVTCLRDEGSTLKCNDVGITSGTGSVPGAAVAFTITESISKNSSITKEIYVDSNFVNPTTLQAEVSKVNYDATSETYSVIAQ
jgi:S-layer homology domain